jgi:hypothetical protein
VFKTVLLILNYLIKTSCHCLTISSMNILNNFGDIGHPCFTPWFICISLLAKRRVLRFNYYNVFFIFIYLNHICKYAATDYGSM